MEKPSRKELLKMPQRKWNDNSRRYKQILLVPAGTKHDSGWMHIAIIGVFVENGENKYEIAGYPDDISCHFPHMSISSDPHHPYVRMDCWYPQGILQYHGPGSFTVGDALSSTDIYFYPDRPLK